MADASIKKKIPESVENVLVGLRLKPTDQESICSQVKDNSIMLKKNNETFTFDYVFNDQTTSQEIFESSLQHIVEKSFIGINGCICAYGQTSSGKTFTMKGNQQQPGLVPLTMKFCFDYIKKQTQLWCNLKASYIELYNETIFDLLSQQRNIIEVQAVSGGGVQLIDIKEVQLDSFEKFEEVYSFGEEQRQFGETKLNETSSRSHVIFQIVIETKLKNCPLKQSIANLYLVDLAGSESITKTQTEGLRRKEGMAINRSLLALQNVVMRLKEKKDKYVNFRDSKLTRLLQNNLCGSSLTFMLLTISQNSDNYFESINTMRFGMAAGALKTIVKPNETHLVSSQLYDIQEQLQKQISDKDEEINQLNQLIDSKNDENDQIKQENIFLKDQNEKLYQQLQELDRKYQKLNNEKQDLLIFSKKMSEDAKENANYVLYYQQLLKEKECKFTPPVKKETSCQTDEIISNSRGQIDENDYLKKVINTLNNENQLILNERDSQKEKLDEEISQLRKEMIDLKKMVYSKNKVFQTPKKNPDEQTDEYQMIYRSLKKNGQFLEALQKQSDFQCEIIQKTKQLMLVQASFERLETKLRQEESHNLTLQKKIFELQELIEQPQFSRKFDLNDNFTRSKSKEHIQEPKQKIFKRIIVSPTKLELKRNLLRQEEKNKLFEKELDKYIKALSQSTFFSIYSFLARKEKEKVQLFCNEFYIKLVENNICPPYQQI